MQGSVKDINELPLMLTMRHVRAIVGCGKDAVYRFPHIKGFPAIRFGKLIRVPRDQFFAWLEAQANGQEK